MKKITILLAFLAFGLTQTTAQKYGYLNLGELVQLLPETKSAESELEAYQKQLVAEGEQKAQKFQEKYAQFATDVQSGTLSPKQQEERQIELQKEQQSIVQLEQELAQKVGAKRDELLGPIIDKALKAIEEVAKENGYAMIFDTSVFNAVLYTQESDNVLPLVKKKLGIE